MCSDVLGYINVIGCLLFAFVCDVQTTACMCAVAADVSFASNFCFLVMWKHCKNIYNNINNNVETL